MMIKYLFVWSLKKKNKRGDLNIFVRHSVLKQNRSEKNDAALSFDKD